MEVSVIVSTFNSPDLLEKVLLGYNQQTYRFFEVIIADDGSTEETALRIQKLGKQMFYSIIHVWQPDDGFQKSRILNKAIGHCNSPYIIMSDGDCIPRNDFVMQHLRHSRKGRFLSGGYFKLPMSISKCISETDVTLGHCFDLKWLEKQGLKKTFRSRKLTSNSTSASILNWITPTRATWNGHNSSGWKEDILAVNGFDERMQYGGQDREFGERLVNYGIRGKQIRYSAICIHLDHSRDHQCINSIQKNKLIRENTRRRRLVRTEFGIEQDPQIEHVTDIANI